MHVTTAAHVCASVAHAGTVTRLLMIDEVCAVESSLPGFSVSAWFRVCPRKRSSAVRAHEDVRAPEYAS